MFKLEFSVNSGVGTQLTATGRMDLAISTENTAALASSADTEDKLWDMETVFLNIYVRALIEKYGIKARTFYRHLS